MTSATRIRALLLASSSLSLLIGCSSAPKPLPAGPPPVYEPPRPYQPKSNIDHVDGEVKWAPKPTEPSVPPERR